VLSYRVILDVPLPLVVFVSRVLAAHRHEIDTRDGTRALTCWKQAVFTLAWFWDRPDIARLGQGFGISQATAYRYKDEAAEVLAATAPTLREALGKAVEQGLPNLILDRTLISCDRCADKKTSRSRPSASNPERQAASVAASHSRVTERAGGLSVGMHPGDAVEVGQGEGDRVNAVVVAAGVTADVDPGVSAQRTGDLLEVPGSARVVDLDAEPVNGELADDDLTAVAGVAEAAHQLQHLLVQPGGVEAVGDAVVEVEADEAPGM
jgi:hypothetical protein